MLYVAIIGPQNMLSKQTMEIPMVGRCPPLLLKQILSTPDRVVQLWELSLLLHTTRKVFVNLKAPLGGDTPDGVKFHVNTRVRT